MVYQPDCTITGEHTVRGSYNRSKKNSGGYFVLQANFPTEKQRDHSAGRQASNKGKNQGRAFSLNKLPTATPQCLPQI